MTTCEEDPLRVRIIALAGSLSRPDGLAVYGEGAEPSAEPNAADEDGTVVGLVLTAKRGGVLGEMVEVGM